MNFIHTNKFQNLTVDEPNKHRLPRLAKQTFGEVYMKIVIFEFLPRPRNFSCIFLIRWGFFIESSWYSKTGPYVFRTVATLERWSSASIKVTSIITVTPHSTQPIFWATADFPPPVPWTKSNASGRCGKHLIIRNLGVASFWKFCRLRSHIACIAWVEILDRWEYHENILAIDGRDDQEMVGGVERVDEVERADESYQVIGAV